MIEKVDGYAMDEEEVGWEWVLYHGQRAIHWYLHHRGAVPPI